MIINTSKVEMVLTNKAITAYSLEAALGISRDTISKFRRGHEDIEEGLINEHVYRNADDELILSIIEELLKLGKPIDRNTLPKNFKQTYCFGTVELPNF